MHFCIRTDGMEVDKTMNSGQRKLLKWIGGRSIRSCAKAIGVDYRSLYRWAIEGIVPGFSGRKKCHKTIGIEYDAWDRK